ncbi:hypothetical protein AAVH_25717 [Aphelenchoides avenae]|nr:hypothetical protein AAVH_25717 [Aphelenchus avenae]
MPKKSEKTMTTIEKVALPRDLQLKWDDVQIEMKKAQVASANATKKVDEFALDILQRKYANCGTQTEASMTIRAKDLPERLRNADVAELLRELKVLNDLHAVHDEVASGDFGSTIRRKLKELASNEVKTEKLAVEDCGRTEDEAKVGAKVVDGIEVPSLKHEDRNREERRSRHEDRAASEDRRSLPRPGRTPPRLPRRKSPSKSPERDGQWKADLITARIRQAQAAGRTPSQEARDDRADAIGRRREHRSRSRSLAPSEQRHDGSPAPDGRRHRRPTPVSEHHRRYDGCTGPRRPPVSPIPDEQRRRHPPPSPTDGNATKDAKPKDEEPRADEEAVLESGDDEGPPVLEKCAQTGEAKPEEGEIDEDDDKRSMPVVAPSKKSAEDNPLEAGRTHRKRTAPGRPRAPKKKKAKSAEIVEDSSDSDGETETKKRRDKRKKKSMNTEAARAKTGEVPRSAEEAERQLPSDEKKKNESAERENGARSREVAGVIGPRTPFGSPRRSASRSRSPPKKRTQEDAEKKENEAIEGKQDEPKEVPGIVYPDTRSRSPSRSPSPSRSQRKKKTFEEEEAEKAESDASDSGSSSSSDSSSNSGTESEAEEEK